MADSTLLPHAPIDAGAKATPGSRTRVLAVSVDVDTVQSLLSWQSESALQVETASDFLSAMERLLGEEWDLVVAIVGDAVESDLRHWLEALGEARGHPRFIALVRQSSGAPASSDCASTLAELEARHIAGVMKETGGRIESAARILGIHRNTLARKLKGLGNSGVGSPRTGREPGILT
jgi:transcriptional regulator with GAF, ATPase, and Fis domain